MQTKMFEIRDRGTFIPVIAIKPGAPNPAGIGDPLPQPEGERYLWDRAGYGQTATDHARYVILMSISGGAPLECHYNCYEWTPGGKRTLFRAHEYIIANWDDLRTGQVIDVEFILGETPAPKISERKEYA